jgi:lipopolysaccharide export LptBFGC system permease protein LptF
MTRKLILLIVWALFLVACASTPNQGEQLATWYFANFQKIENKEITAAALHVEAYERSQKFDDAQIIALRKFFAKMIPISRKYDAGELSLTQYKDIHRLELLQSVEDGKKESQSNAAEQRARYCMITGKC